MFTLWIATGAAFVVSFAAKLAADAWLHERVALAGSFLGLTPSRNPGIAFGFLLPEGYQTPIIVAALLLVAYSAYRSAADALTRWGFGLILGGAIANVADRARDGFVTDFFQVGSFPIFNVADSCITIGVGLLLLEMVLQRWRVGRG